MATIGFGTTESWLYRGDGGWLASQQIHAMKIITWLSTSRWSVFCGFCWLRVKGKDKLQAV